MQRTGDDTVRVGITDYAQSALGDVVFVQLPDVGADVTAGESFGEVESTKSVSDLYAPVSAKVVAVNGDLESKPAAGQLRSRTAKAGSSTCRSDAGVAGGRICAGLLDADGYRAIGDRMTMLLGFCRPHSRNYGGRIRRWWTQRCPPRGTVDTRRMTAGGARPQISPQQPVRSSG